MSSLYESASSASVKNQDGSTLFNIFNISPSSLDSIVIALHMFTLAWVVFNTLWLLADFYVKYFKFPKYGDFLKNHLDGKKQFYASWNSWSTYFPILVITWLYSTYRDTSPWNIILFGLFITACVWKVFFVELPKTPIHSVLKGEDQSIIGKFFKRINAFGGGKKQAGKAKKDTSKSTNEKTSKGIVGEFARQIGGIGEEASRQMIGGKTESKE